MSRSEPILPVPAASRAPTFLLGRVALMAVVATAVNTGCASGPDYHPPATRLTAAGSFVSQPADTNAAASPQPDWWKLYNDAALGNLVQVPFSYDYANRRPFDEPSGRDAQGFTAMSRFYRAADNWIYVDTSERELGKLDRVDGLKGIAAAEDPAAFLASALDTASAGTWQNRLQAANIAAAVPDNIVNLRRHNSRPCDDRPGIDNGSYSFSVYADHPSGRCVTQLDPFAIRPRHARIRALQSAEKFGASTHAVLREFGYSDAEIEMLMARHAVGDSWSEEYLPS